MASKKDDERPMCLYCARTCILLEDQWICNNRMCALYGKKQFDGETHR
jgi:hypothetical protein